MSNYLDNLDVIDANGHITNVLLQDRGTLALANQCANRLNNLTIYNVKDYGAVGDGIVDDTEAIRDTMTAAGSGIIYFPKGTYLITQSIIVSNDYCTFLGQGIGKSIIMTNNAITMFNVQNNYSADFFDLEFKHFNDGNVIEYNGGENSTVSRCTFLLDYANDVQYGVIFYVSNIEISDCHFDMRKSNSYGVKASIKTNGININSNIHHNYFGWTGSGILVTSEVPDDFRLEGLKISENVFICTGLEQIGLFVAFDVNICDNMMDQGTNCISGLSTGNMGLSSIRINSNYISAYSQEFSTGINLNGGYALSIINNKFAYNGYGIAIDGITDVLISDNMFNNIRHSGISAKNTPKCNICDNMFGYGTNFSLDLTDGLYGTFLIAGNNFNTTNKMLTVTSAQHFVIGVNNGMGEMILASKTVAISDNGDIYVNIDFSTDRAVNPDKVFLTVDAIGTTCNVDELKLISVLNNSITVSITASNFGTDTSCKINALAILD